MSEYVPTPEQTAQWPRHIVAAAAAIFDDAGRVLLVRSGWRGWEFPGGQVEQGEDLLTGLAREVGEESGCRITVGRLLGVSSLSPTLGSGMEDLRTYGEGLEVAERDLREMRREPAVEPHAVFVAGDDLLANAAHAPILVRVRPANSARMETTTEIAT